MIDECHLMFTASNYRAKLAHLKWLQVLKCLMVLLTATLLLMLEDELSESMLVQYARYIQAITVRPNIRYMVQQCELGKLSEMTKEICWRQERKLATEAAVTAAEAGADGGVR